MFSFEKKIMDYIKNNIVLFLGIIITICSIIIRLKFWDFESSDYTYFLYEWFKIIRHSGGLVGLQGNFYNYYIPYMCIITLPTYFHRIDYFEFMVYLKTISVISEFVCALLAMRIANKVIEKNIYKKYILLAVYVCVICSPMVIFDGAIWAQCDYIYAAFILWGIDRLIKEKYLFAFILFGCAFSFKLQTIFILPALAIIYFCKKKFSILQFLWIPFMYLLSGLPAILWGKGIKETYSIYFGQVDSTDTLTANAPNFWTFFPHDTRFSFLGISILVILFSFVLIICLQKKGELDNKDILWLFSMSAGLCFMFLPGMHERYCSLWMLFAYVYCLLCKKKGLILVFIMDIFTCMTYMSFLYSGEYNVAVPYWVISLGGMLLLCVVGITGAKRLLSLER